MFSLLTMELEKYDTNIVVSSINNLEKKIIQSKDINNKKQTKICVNIRNELNEYRLNNSIFNPAKNSPPNAWQIRLESRIKNLHAN
jgi:hypothetical protein